VKLNKKTILIIACTGFLFAFNIQKSFGCSCIKPPPSKQLFKKAVAVFTGRVIELKSPFRFFKNYNDRTKVTINVDTIWKGTKKETITLSTPKHRESCGVSFVKGNNYLIYAFGTESNLTVNQCGRVLQIGEATKDLAELGEGTVVKK